MANQSKVALVVGASGGIGGAIVERLARDGYDIAAHYVGNPNRINDLAKAVAPTGGRVISIQADVSSEKDVKTLFEATLNTFGRIDAVVHTAGIMPISKIIDGDIETFDRVITTNLRGTFLVLSQAAQHISEGGRIIAFSSSVLAKSFPAYGPYIASKAGVEGLIRVLANELRGRNITVNAIAPGPTGTELFLNGKADTVIDELARLSPLERIGTPDDIASIVSFLVGPDGGWINAQVVRANGGFA